MADINTLWRQYLTAQGATVGDNNKALLAHLMSLNGTTSGSIPDNWMIYLTAQGFTTGGLTDRMGAFLRSKGYTGDMTAMIYASLTAGDLFFTPSLIYHDTFTGGTGANLNLWAGTEIGGPYTKRGGSTISVNAGGYAMNDTSANCYSCTGATHTGSATIWQDSTPAAASRFTDTYWSTSSTYTVNRPNYCIGSAVMGFATTGPIYVFEFRLGTRYEIGSGTQPGVPYEKVFTTIAVTGADAVVTVYGDNGDGTVTSLATGSVTGTFEEHSDFSIGNYSSVTDGRWEEIKIWDSADIDAVLGVV